MDQELKQRLVGVMVVTAVAAIFVPMLFDDPVDESGKMVSELAIPASPIKSFDEVRANLPTGVAEVQALETIPETIKAIEDKPVSEVLQRWWIQLATFSNKETALQLRDELRQQGYKAFLAPIAKEKGAALYRLRVGPLLDKDEAEKMLLKLNQLKGFDSILLSEE